VERIKHIGNDLCRFVVSAVFDELCQVSAIYIFEQHSAKVMSQKLNSAVAAIPFENIGSAALVLCACL